VWRMQGAKRKKKREGNRKNDYMGIKKDLEIQKKGEKEEKEDIMVERMKYGKASLRIVRLYVNGDTEKKLEELKE